MPKFGTETLTFRIFDVENFAIISLLCNENLNTFLTRLRKLFKGENYSRKYGALNRFYFNTF